MRGELVPVFPVQVRRLRYLGWCEITVEIFQRLAGWPWSTPLALGGCRSPLRGLTPSQAVCYVRELLVPVLIVEHFVAFWSGKPGSRWSSSFYKECRTQ